MWPMCVPQGMVVLAVSAWLPGLTPGPQDDEAKWYQSAALFGSLYIVALGTGGIKPNVSAFGADQFDVSDPQVRPVCLLLKLFQLVLGGGGPPSCALVRDSAVDHTKMVQLTITTVGVGSMKQLFHASDFCCLQERTVVCVSGHPNSFTINTGQCRSS